MAIDEFHFHRARGLSRWERWGHPLDTLTVMLPMGIALWQGSLPLFCGTSIFSSLFVTKDEWVHRVACSPLENWLHSVLFLLHPVLFYAVWQLRDQPHVLAAIFCGVALFFVHQVVYWGIYRRGKG